MIMMPVWLRNVFVSLLVGLTGYSLTITAAYLLSSPTGSPDRTGAVFVSTVDPLCERMIEVDRALCLIAVDRPAYGREESDGAITYAPDGRALVRDCLSYEDSDAPEEFTQCLLSASQTPGDSLPVCPDNLLDSLQSCVYLDANDSPIIWRVK